METKKQYKWFSIFEYEKEQEYLSMMHKDGWKFLKVSGLGVYRFEKCEPKDVVYQLDYNKDGLEHRDEYIKMFADCGWEHLQDYAGYSYFRKAAEDMSGEEEIFCDKESRLMMMNRVLKGRMIPLLILFFCIVLPQLLLQSFVYKSILGAAIYAVVTVIYVCVFLWSFHNYKKFKE